MAKISVKIDEDMIKLISCINFMKFPNLEEKTDEQYVRYGIDMNSIYGGNFVLEDISRILGLYDKHIEGTEDNAQGPSFPDEIEDKMLNLHRYLVDNLCYIEQILHQFCWKGGITPGIYECKDYEMFWTKKK